MREGGSRSPGDEAVGTDGDGPSRRRFLALAAGAGALAGVGGATGAAAGGTTGAAAGGSGTAAGRSGSRIQNQQDDAIPEGGRVGLETVAEGFAAPLGLEVAPEDGDRRFVVDQPGQVYVVAGGRRREEPFLDVSDRIVDLGDASPGRGDERGLLGLAFHPGFAENRRLFVHYSAPPREGTPDGYDHTAVVAEFQVTDDGQRADPDSGLALLEIPSPAANHNGGGIAFGPDGYLYVAVGDGGGEGDAGPGHAHDWYERNAGGNGQDVTENLLGSVLRIDVDEPDSSTTGTPSGSGDVEESTGGEEKPTGGEERPYAVPEDNPLVGRAGLDEQYAWGFRDPRHLSFDSRGRLFVTDVDWNGRGEVNLVERGGNYGWNVRVGTRCFDADAPLEPPDDCPDRTPDDVRGGEPLRDPVVEYPPRESPRLVNEGSILVGGHVHESDAIEHLRGTYVFGNWSATGAAEAAGQLLVATPPEARKTPTDTPTATPTPTPTPSPTGTAVKTVYKLGATRNGWQGRSPADIEAKLNPTLTLVPGRTYEVTWQNLDGKAHNFALVDDEGNVLVSSQFVNGKGMTQTFEFEATRAMAGYRCKAHPTTMRGTIELVDGEQRGDGGKQGGGGENQSSDGGGNGGGRDGSSGSDHGTWPLERLVVESTGDGRVDGYVYGFGRDGDGDLYVLTGESPVPAGESGAVRRLVPPGAGGDDVG